MSLPFNMAAKFTTFVLVVTLFWTLSCHGNVAEQESAAAVVVPESELEGSDDVDDAGEEDAEEGEDLILEAIVSKDKRPRQKPGTTPYNRTEHLLPWLKQSSANITYINATSALLTNLTDRWTANKISCVPRNLTENETAAVRIVNSTELLYTLTQKNDSQGLCAVVMFYAPWCRFCAQVAPHFNALARAFPQLDVLAIDAINFNNLNARFGTIAVPNMLIFYNSRAVARFNNSMRTLEAMISFVTNITGVEGNKSVEVTPQDYDGPLSSTPTQDMDYLLWISWIFIIGFSIHMASNTATAHKIWNFLASFGQEHHHQHID